MNTITFLNKDTNDISNMIGLALDQYEYTNEQKVRYTFCIEETLLKWKEELPADEKVTVIRKDSASSFSFDISIPGKKADSLAENTSTDILEALVPRIKSGVGHELQYTYKHGVNRLTLNLPKKKTEATLFYKNMWFISIPIILQNILLSISSTVDSIMLSFLNQDAMSAASLVSVLTFIFNAALIAYTSSMTTTFGKYWSRRDFDIAGKVLGYVLKIAFITGILFTLGCFVVPGFIMNVFTDVESIKTPGVSYMRYLAVYFIFTSMAEVFICFMRNAGAVVLSSVFVIISQIINVILNGILIFGLFGMPAMGIRGAAISTSVSGIIMFVLSFSWFLKKKYISLKTECFKGLSKSIRREYNGIMVPLFVSSVSWWLGNAVIASVLGHISADVVAADAIKNTVYNFFSCYNAGTAAASGLLQSKAIGQRNMAKVERNGKYIIRYCSVTAAVVVLILAAGIPFYQYMFGELSAATLHFLRFMLIISVLRLYLGIVSYNTNCGMFYPAGDTKTLLIIDNVIKWGIIILPAFLGTFVFKLPVYLILILVNADEIISFIPKHLHYLKGVWLKMLMEADKKV